MKSLRFKIAILLPALLLSFSCTCLSQKPGFTNFTVDDGLAQSQVPSMAQDQYGFLWMATLGGVSRFDGHVFRNYDKTAGLLSPLIYHTFIDRQNRLWVITQKGVQVFDGRKFSPVSLPPKIQGKAITRIKQDSSGRIYLLSAGNILYVNGMTGNILNTESLHAPVVKIETDRHGKVYAITDSAGIYSYTGNGWEYYMPTPEKTSGAQVLLFFDRKNTPYIITKNSLYEYASGRMIKKLVFSETNNKTVSAEEDNEGRLWIGTASGAFAVNRNHTVTHYHSQNGLTDNMIYDIQLDREGNLWFASDAAGVYKLNNKTFTYLDKNSGLNSNIVMGVARDGNDMWVGTAEQGLSKFDANTLTSYPLPAANGRLQKINSLFRDSQARLWIGTLDGGLWIKENTVSREILNPKGLPMPTVIAMCEQSDGTIWLATSHGPYYVKDNIVTRITASRDICFSIMEIGKDSMLLGTSAGVQLLTGKTKISEIPLQPLSNITVSCLMRFGKYILIGTSEDGIIYLDPLTKEIRNCTKKDGLASNFIFSLYPSISGEVWVGTGSGIHKVRLDEPSKKFAVKKYSVFNSAFGPECNLNAVTGDAQGRIWFGTIKGIVIYTPGKNELTTSAPMIYLKSVQLFSKEIAGPDTLIGWNRVPRGLSLSPSENHLSFDFTSIYLTNPSEVQYRYMLEGADTAYSPPSPHPQVIYPSLPPGTYVFKAFAVTADGTVSGNTIHFPFTIATPFYQTTWFRLLAILALVGTGVMIQYTHVRLKQKRLAAIRAIRLDEQRKIQERTSEDLHDDLGNKITRITVLADVLHSKIAPEDADRIRLVKQIKENAQSLYLSTKDIIWSLSPGNDNLYDIFDRVQMFAIHFFEDTPVEFTLSGLQENHKQVFVSLITGRNLVMIIKESLNNILKHAGASKALISILHTNNDSIEVTIEDNGKGIDISRANKGLGMENIKKRAARINGRFEIQQNHPHGTILRLTIKIPPNEGYHA